MFALLIYTCFIAHAIVVYLIYKHWVFLKYKNKIIQTHPAIRKSVTSRNKQATRDLFKN